MIKVPNDFLIFLTAGFVILVVMLIFFGGGISYTNTYRLGPGGMGISHKVNGTVLIGPEDVSDFTSYNIDINTSYTKGETVHEAEGKELFNGLLFGSNAIRYELETTGIESLSISFEVMRTNSYAPLTIKVNDQVVERKIFSAGKYSINADKSLLSDKLTVEFMVDSSSWKIWAPALYSLDNIKIAEKSYSYNPNEIRFVVREEEYRTFTEGKIELQLDENMGNFLVKVNDNPVYSDVVSDYQAIKFTKDELRIGENVLQLRADVNSKFLGSARMIVFYKTQREHLFEQLFNLTQTEYNMLDRGTISFEIVEVIQDGGLSIKILGGSEELFSEYSSVAEGDYSYSFGKGDVRAGLNRIVIQSVDDAAFSIADFEVKY